MLAGVLIISFWAYLIWIWRLHQPGRIGSTYRNGSESSNRWN